MEQIRLAKSMARVVLTCISVTWLHGAGLSYLAAHADAVVVGSVTSRVESPSQISFTINIARVLKGSLSGSTVKIVHSWAGLLRGSARNLDQQLDGIWFLKAGVSGNWDVLTARPAWVRTVLGLFLPAPPVPPSGLYSYPAGTPLVEALVYETAAGTQSAKEDPELLRGAFDSMDTPAVRAVLANCSSSGSPAFQAVGLAGTLERGIPGAIQQLAHLWPVIDGDPHATDVVAALRDSWRDPTPAAVQQVASFARTLPIGSDIRVAAIRALAAIHTKESLPFLAALLSSPTAVEQERGVYGLSAFANGCPIQTKDNTVSMTYLQCGQSAYKTQETSAHFAFRPGSPDQESALVSFWKIWWNRHPELH